MVILGRHKRHVCWRTNKRFSRQRSTPKCDGWQFATSQRNQGVVFTHQIQIITPHNNCTVLVYVWSVAPQIKCPGHPFSSKMMMSLKRLKSFLLSEEVLDYLRKMEGTIIDHLITEKVVYDESVIIRFTWLTKSIYFKIFIENLSEKQRTIIIPGLCQILENEWFDTWDCLKLHC